MSTPKYPETTERVKETKIVKVTLDPFQSHLLNLTEYSWIAEKVPCPA